MTTPTGLRIGIVIDTVEPFYRGGYETRAWQLARRLSRQHQVTIFTSMPGKSRLIDGVCFRSVLRRDMSFKSDGFRSLRRSLEFALKLLLFVIRKPELDVVDCNATPYVHVLSAWVLAKRSGAAFIVTAHEALVDQIPSYLAAKWGRAGWILGRLAQWVYLISLKQADLIVASSEIAGQELRREGFDRVLVNEGAICGKTALARSEMAGQLVYLGRLVPNKRVGTLLEAVALARHQGIDCTLLVIGDGPCRDALEELGRQYLGGYVRFVGNVSDAERDAHLAASDAYVSASYREGISIATLEAMSTGLPVIVSSQPDRAANGALYYVRHGENGLVTDGSAAGLASGIRALESLGYQHLSCAALETARHYTWDAAAEHLEEVYQTLVTDPTGRPPVQRRPRHVGPALAV